MILSLPLHHTPIILAASRSTTPSLAVFVREFRSYRDRDQGCNETSSDRWAVLAPERNSVNESFQLFPKEQFGLYESQQCATSLPENRRAPAGGIINNRMYVAGGYDRAIGQSMTVFWADLVPAFV